jgi:RHS repeat-associated protein
MDEYGHVVELIDPAGGVTRTESDRYGRVLSRTDQLGGTVRLQRDERGDVIRVERQDGSVLCARYDAFRRPLELVDADGSRWCYTYDEKGNLTSATDPVGGVTGYAHNERGALTGVLDALGRRTAVTVDAAGLPVEITAATGAALRLERDERGRVVRIVDPLGAVTALGYDEEDRHLSRTFPDGGTETWRYDAAGNLLAHTDQAGLETRFEVGPFRVLTARIDPDGTRHAFEYDSQLRLTSVTDPAGLRWTYAFDAAGNLVGETDFNGRALTYRHDAAGRLVERVNGAGQHVELVRDALGRVVGQLVDGEHAAAFTYDANSRLTHAGNATTELRYSLDGLGRVLEEEIDGSAVRTAYDALGQVVERTTPSARVSAWSYDALGNTLTLTADGRERLSFGYDAFGRETYRWLGSHTALTQEFDTVGRMTARRLLAVEGGAASNATSSRVLLERGWTYRADDTPTSVTDSFSGGTQFQLDPLGRVTAVTAETWHSTYAYDATGNIADEGGSGPRELTGTLLRSAGRTRYAYDGQGRMAKAVRRTLSGGELVWEYVYDAFDRIVEASTPHNGRWRYRYDPLGRRVAKQRLGEEGTPVEEYRFAWDGTTLAEQRHEVAGQDRATVTSWDYQPGGFTPVAQVTRTLPANTSDASDASDASDEEIDRRFHAIVTDLVGTPTELVALDGGIAWRRRASLWGGLAPGLAAESELYCPLRFPGQYHDAETGLYYNYERYYDPDTGRYNTPDPLGLDPAPNHHGYVANPVSHLDPLGLRDFLSDDGRNRLRQIAARHGGVELPDSNHGIGNFQFPNRRAARAAASEVAGDLGSQAKPIRASSYRGAPRGTNPDKIMGQSNADPGDPHDNHGTAGWRDDQWGHDFGDGNKVGPHVNAWNSGQGIGNSHLYYKTGGGPCP